MAETKKNKSVANKGHHHKKNRGYGASKYKSNPAKHHHHKHIRRRRNAGGMANLSGYVTNAVFVIVGALGSKLGAQAILGANNTGVIGYAANAAVGAGMYLITEHVMKNREASSGIIAGTLVQILLRAINDFTPFGSYVSGLGFGDYQMQSFVTPQVLVDPWNSASILIPNGWGQPPTPVALPAPAAAAGGPAGGPGPGRSMGAPAPAAAPAAGMSGMYGNTYGDGWGALY